ncbi:MAG: aminotransferase class I/II-fold pyridoxal phosphate-dependent enzyme [Phycisphaeraceae bacterium]|nr:aminotransferase class I/II-fold pyridoxal phosphate-dependent enzyme [Phycisphaeraceae bacterium]
MSNLQNRFDPHAPDPRTVALHGRESPQRRPAGQPLVTPIVQSTTYAQGEVGGECAHAYSRVSNPTIDELESTLGALESAPPAVAFSSGLAAEFALMLALVKAGDHIVFGGSLYGGTVRLAQQILAPLGVESTFVDATRPERVAEAITAGTRLIFVESPANPTLELTDIAAVSAVARRAGGLLGREIPLAVDNTFHTAVIQRPLDLGADVSVYATTKHIDGHSSALGGAVVTRNEALLTRLRFVRKATGGIQTPFNGWLTLQGIRTLPLRIREHSRNALEAARWLSGRPEVSRVIYPGLEMFGQRELAERQHLCSSGGERLHGGVIAFDLKGGVPAAKRLLASVRLCVLVEHVGAAHTLLTHPATMTHADVPREQRERVGVTDGLIRLSVGLEDPRDVIADLGRAIEASSAIEVTTEGSPAGLQTKQVIGTREVRPCAVTR